MISSLLATLLLSSPPPGEITTSLRWERSFDDALKKAKVTRKPLMVDFWAEWCGWCRRLDRTTYVDPAVVQMGQEFVLVKVNTDGTPRESAVALRYGVTSLPTIVFVAPSGRMLLRLSGYQGPGQFPVTMEQARETAIRIMGWETALDKTPQDAEALMGLAVHHYETKTLDESRELFERVVKVDANRPTPRRKQARLLLAAIVATQDDDYARAEALLKEGLAIQPPASDYDPKLLYFLGKTYLSWGKPAEARAALQEVVTAHAQSPVAQKARETLVALDHRK